MTSINKERERERDITKVIIRHFDFVFLIFLKRKEYPSRHLFQSIFFPRNCMFLFDRFNQDGCYRFFRFPWVTRLAVLVVVVVVVVLVAAAVDVPS